jgi:ligand-binding sensor domain-containing protein/serine phosphatase RsbU (regulator of sigma subunit)
MNKMTAAILFVAILFIKEITPQSNIRFNHLTVSDGLSQSAVTCILQDKSGFMWFGTQDGLNRFDGYTFKIFKNDPTDTTSLSDNFISSICEDKNGNLLIETQRGTFNQYNPKTESFALVKKDKIDFANSKLNTLKAFFIESNGIVWTGGQSKPTGLTRTDSKTGKITNFKHSLSDPSGLSDDKVYSIFKDRTGKLWIGTANGLDRFDEKSGKFFHYRHDPKNSSSISDNWVWPIFEDSHGELWIGTVHGGLCRFNPETNKFITYKNNPDDPTSIKDDFINSIYEDRSGVIWIGTSTGGINYFNPNLQAFELFTNDPNDKNSLSDNSVLSLQADREGNYWVGTSTGGLDKLDYSKRKFTNYSHNPANSNSLLSNSIQTITVDRSGILWIGNFSSGLNSFDPSSGIFKRYVNNPSDPNSLTDNRIYSILEDKEGTIWIGTYDGGLNKLDRETGKFIAYQSNKNDSTSISSNRTWSLAEDNKGNLWIGTFGGGVNVFDKSTHKFKHYKNNPNDPASLGDDQIIRVFRDSKGNMWFGSTKGLIRYYSETNKFKSYREIDGLANDYVFGILEDDRGFLWLSTNGGLSKFNPKDETFKNYYYNDGLQGNEFNQNAFAKDINTGRLLFGGSNGFNVFHPDSIKNNTFLPPIVFTNYLRYNTDDQEGKPIIEKGISERDSINLTYKDNIITFDFAALSFLNSSDNQYRYKLEGFNQNWIQLGNHHTITFTNLSAGNYNLKVIGSNNDALWNENGTSLQIHVTPPWWKTKIAYGIYFITFFSFMYGLRRYEINRREQKAQIRESALRIKATEAEKRTLEIENERKTKELEEARQLQLSMLPKKLPELPNFEIAAFMRTATEVGGDYYDFRVLENGGLYVAFGDATGHGLQAGTMVTLMKGFFTSDSSKLGMQEFMNHCSRMIKEIELGRILMSFSYLKFEGNKLFMTSAGMPPIFYYEKKSDTVEEIVIQGMPLGAMRNFPYKVIEKEVSSGDTILLLTDGLPEQMNTNEEMFDYSRVKTSFNEVINNKPNDIINKLVTAGDDWMNGRIQDDDITFVVIRAN